MITEDLPNTKKTIGADLSWLCQPAQGYRFTEDAIILANFITIRPDETLLDLCSGVGIVPIALAQRQLFASGIGVEIQEALIACAWKNLQIAGMADRFAMMHGDVCGLHPGDFHSFLEGKFLNGFDVVSANPPFHLRHAGRLNPNWQRAIARHELLLTLPELVASAWRCLKPGGRFYLVHRFNRQKEIEALMLSHRMAVAKVEFPNSGDRRSPLILLEVVKNDSAQGCK